MAGPLFESKTLAVRPDWPRAEIHEINLSGNRLSLTIPGRLSKDFPVERIDHSLNIYAPELFGKWAGFTVAERHWNYGGRLWQGSFGIMSMTIRIHRPPQGVDRYLFDPANLEHLIHSTLIDEYEPRNQKKRDKGDLRLIVELPRKYEEAVMNGNRWLRYSLGGYFDKTCYAIALTADRHLELAFRYMVVDSEKSGWRKPAEVDANKILSTVRLKYAERSSC